MRLAWDGVVGVTRHLGIPQCPSRLFTADVIQSPCMKLTEMIVEPSGFASEWIYCGYRRGLHLLSTGILEDLIYLFSVTKLEGERNHDFTFVHVVGFDNHGY